MGVKFYGTCTGSSGNKYNIWLEVSENSHSIETNTSNVTVELKLKRNDGYSASEYNLDKSDNFTKITINDEVKASKNLEIDTRNNVTVTLLSWTGDLAHNVDGALNIAVLGSFTMSGTSLSGGSTSGNFECITILQSSTFSVNKSSAIPQEEITITISSASKSFSHKVIYEIGEYKESKTISAGVTSTAITIPIEWANALPNAKRGIVTISLKTYDSSSAFIGNSVKSIYLKIPETEDFLPIFNVRVTSNKSSNIPGNWQATIKNNSTITVKINSAYSNYGAEIVSGSITFDGITKKGMEADFSLHNSGVRNIICRVTDSRGFSKEETVLVSVEDYFPPVVVCNNIIRCDSSGTPSADGNCALIDFTKIYASVNGLNYATVKVKYRKNSESEYSDYITLSTSPAIVSGDFDKTSSYEFLFNITDALKNTYEAVRVLPSGNVAFNIKKNGNGAAFGCYAEADNELTVGYNLNVKGFLKYNDLINMVTYNSNFSKQFLQIKNYECLGLTTLKASFKVDSTISSNAVVTVFKLTSSLPSVMTPLNIVTGNINIDKDLRGYINQVGEINIISTSSISVGTVININGFY